MYEALSLLTNYAIAAWRRRWFGVALAWLVCVAGWLAVERIPDRYQSSAQINIDTTSMLRPLMAGIAADLSAGTMAQLNVVRQSLLTRPNLEKVMRATDLDLKAKNMVEQEQIMASLRSRLNISGGGDNQLFSVSFVDKDPQLAHDVVNALLNIFVETNLGANREDIATTQRFLDNQLADMKQQIDTAEQNLTKFEMEYQSFLPGAGSYDEQLRQTQGLLAELKAQRTQADALRGQLSAQLSRLAEGDSSADTMIATHIARIAELKRQIDDLLTRYTESHPDVVVAQRQLEREETELEAAGGAEAASSGGLGQPSMDQLQLQIAEQNAAVIALDDRISKTEPDIARLQALVAQMPEVMAQHAQMQREYQIIQSGYSALIERREAARFAEEVDTKTQPVQFRVVEPPNVPATPSGPDRALLQTGVLVGGLAVGAAFCMLLGLIAGTINNTARLAEVGQRPVLGAVTRLTMPGARRGLVFEQLAFFLVTGSLFAGYLFALYGPTSELSEAIVSRIPVI